MTVPDLPDPLDHTTWVDKDGYHARHVMNLPKTAIRYGCRQQIDADTADELAHEATRNRIKVWAWLSGQRLTLARTADWSEIGDPR